MNARPVAVVTGASRGLGFLLARELADRGHDLVVDSRSEPGLATAATALQERGAAVVTVPRDPAYTNAEVMCLSAGLAPTSARVLRCGTRVARSCT